MISINLTPLEELDDPQWWVPDVSIFGIILLLSMGGVYYYTTLLEEDLALKTAEKDRIIQETTALDGEVTKFNDLSSKLSNLESKKSSLQKITESKLMRYLPIILLENIQNLKPEGIWLDSLAFTERKEENPNGAAAPAPPLPGAATDFPIVIEILGKGRSNIAIAEFMMALKATQNQRFEKSDLRTQLFFNDVIINFTQINSSAQRSGEDSGQTVDVVDFRLILTFKERHEDKSDNTAEIEEFIEEFKREGKATDKGHKLTQAQ